jgi:hypothetical protein
VRIEAHPRLAVTNAGEIATERNTRSIEPRATAAHSPKIFQPAQMIQNFAITLSVGDPIGWRDVADIDDGSEPAKIPGRDFGRKGRVKVHTEVRGLQKNGCSLVTRREYLVLGTKM